MTIIIENIISLSLLPFSVEILNSDILMNLKSSLKDPVIITRSNTGHEANSAAFKSIHNNSLSQTVI